MLNYSLTGFIVTVISPRLVSTPLQCNEFDIVNTFNINYNNKSPSLMA